MHFNLWISGYRPRILKNNSIHKDSDSDKKNHLCESQAQIWSGKSIRGNQRAANWFVDFRLMQYVVYVIDYERKFTQSWFLKAQRMHDDMWRNMCFCKIIRIAESITYCLNIKQFCSYCPDSSFLNLAGVHISAQRETLLSTKKCFQDLSRLRAITSHRQQFQN